MIALSTPAAMQKHKNARLMIALPGRPNDTLESPAS
jgi:hypothetical protein